MIIPTKSIRRATMLFGAAVFLVLAVGCSARADSTADSARQVDAHTCDAECQAQIRADIEYMAENFPTREQALQVRECVTARTGYDEFAELPADYGPPSLADVPSLTDAPGTPEPAHPIEEDMPFRLVERVLVAVGQRKPLRERVSGAFNDCIYDMGLEDTFFTPSHPGRRSTG